MKKALFTGFLGIVFAFAMVACNGNTTENDTTGDTNVVPAQQDEHCMHHCQATCPDSACLAANCENCTCPDSAACHQKPGCKGHEGCHHDGQGCKGHGEGCQGHGEGCHHDGACQKECERK
ncbi:MAG: hypothetical protein J5848_05055 [Bacteroidales bacterium]|nr:hypothetical protein [Bacteroidales bacterium]